MRIIGYHITDGLVVNSEGGECREYPLDFLLERIPDTIKVFYHLDYSVANLFRWLKVNEYEIRKLVKKGEIYLAPYRFGYSEKKYFNVQYGGGRGSFFANFNDMYQFHRNSDLSTLPPADYARQAADIGKRVYEALVKLELNPMSLTSPVRCWEKEVLSKMDLPGMADLPEPVAKAAYDCCDGGWVEAFQKGHWGKTYDYDVRSAYGSFTRNLLDTRYGKWIEAPYYDPSCYYGYGLCNIEATSPFSPITYMRGDEKLTPNGKFPEPKWIGKRQIDHALKYKTAKIEVLDGWWWFPDKLVYPLEDMIDYLFKAKESATGIDKDVYKRILAGIWGKFLFIKQHPKKGENPYGELFNSVYAEEVESGCRCSTSAFVLDHHLEKSTLHVAVDGVLSSAPATILDTGQIGEWKLSNVGAAYVISSGICAVQGKDTDIAEDKENSDFILRYDWLKDQIQRNPNSPCYTMRKLSPVTLQKAISQAKLDRLGEHEEIERTVDITFESKRDYDEKPETGAQLQRRKYYSKPTDIRSIVEIKGANK
jgi:hypothetical protein